MGEYDGLKVAHVNICDAITPLLFLSYSKNPSHRNMIHISKFGFFTKTAKALILILLMDLRQKVTDSCPNMMYHLKEAKSEFRRVLLERNDCNH